jgi:hypothetical protein
MCAVVGLVFALGNLAYLGPTDDALAMRIPLDTVGGLLTVAAIVRFSLYDRLSMLQPFFFMASIALHYVFWTTWANGLDLWAPYVAASNAVFICQLICLAIPGGGNVRRVFARWFGAPRSRRSAGALARRLHRREAQDQS